MSAQRPNILWICTDQQRYDTLGCTGNPFVNTPHIDELARNGVLFEQAYCQSPICTPSRASFLTGRYPRATRCRQNGQSIPADEVLVTKLLADSGYTCGLSGKLHLAPAYPWSEHTTEPRTDDGYSAFNWSHQSMPETPGNQYGQRLKSENLTYQTPKLENSERVLRGMPEANHQSKWCADRAIEFIESRAEPSDQPWFFSVNFFDPHPPFDPPIAYLQRYLDNLPDIPLPAYLPGELDEKPEIQRRSHQGDDKRERNFAWDRISAKEHRLIRAAYWAMVDLIDVQVGRMAEALKRSNQYEQTIIVFMSDHGEMLGDHGIYFKGAFFYEELVRVPLIISWPGRLPAGGRSNALTELIDIAPTLLEATGISPNPGLQGKSLMPLLMGETDADMHRDSIYCENYNASTKHHPEIVFGTMLRTDDCKIVRIHGDRVGELYNLRDDPGETRNLWDDSQYSALKANMLARLTDRMAWTADPLPLRSRDGDSVNYLDMI